MSLVWKIPSKLQDTIRVLIAFSLMYSTNLAANNFPPASTDADFYFDGVQDENKVQLGRLLFFDKILSGNLNISCATCHHALTGSGDGLSLPVGEGGQGLGVTRNTGSGSNEIHERVPRNAPPVFNLGAREFTTMFHDGRLAVDSTQSSGFVSPAGDTLPEGLDNVLAAQAMFPITSPSEMAGQNNENPQAIFASEGKLPQLWEFVASKLRKNTEYSQLFIAAFNEINSPDEIHFVHAANAIAAFEAVVWRFDNSPFDGYLRGDRGQQDRLSKRARHGATLFYGKAGCADCHTGTFQTDHRFHAIAMPQFGPGKGDGESGREDFGRQRVSANNADLFRFRTPSLRNVALTAPYGHTGAFNTLRGILEHHLQSSDSLYNYSLSEAVMPSRPDLNAIDSLVLENNELLNNIAAANELGYIALNDNEIEALLEFLHSLTDPAALDLRAAVPQRVPSGLAIFD